MPEQEALADLIASGTYERHVRSIRRKNADRRAALLDALAEQFGSRMTVTGANTGLHVVAWLTGVAIGREPAILAAAQQAGVGLYPVSPLYALEGELPAEVGFVLGYAALDAEVIRRGIGVLAGALANEL